MLDFFVIEPDKLPSSTSQALACLVIDRWDDWGKYRTQFYLYIFDASGTRHPIGEVKIGQRGLRPASNIAPGQRAPELPQQFSALGDDFFSLGQTESYYESLNTLSPDLRSWILHGLRDISFKLELLEDFQKEDVMSESLLRHVSERNVRGRLHRLSIGDATLTEFQFSFSPSNIASPDSPEESISFSVIPESTPPSNVHAIIGRNGVGKTHFIQSIINEVTSDSHISNPSNISTPWSFSSIISVSFSAFDETTHSERPGSTTPISFVGLRHRDQSGDIVTRAPSAITEDFVESFIRCHEGIKRERWRTATQNLYSDPIFADSNPLQLLGQSDIDFRDAARDFFRRLSSGHKIVLLTVTKLVDLVAEKSLVLMDEPEGHLHPPLLSALIRSISQLLISRNGVGIIATHSPVVLQEVPQSCTWIFHRSGRNCRVERPSIETFGENVSVLTREVFGLEVTNTGFMKILRESIKTSHDYDQVISSFEGKLGTEARAIARSLLINRDKTGI